MRDRVRIFRFLYKLASDAQRLSPDRFARRLVTGLANNYEAVACALFLEGRSEPIARADVHPAFPSGNPAMRALAVELVELAHETGDIASALDLPDRFEPNRALLDEAVGANDLFAFPLSRSGEQRATLVLCLPMSGPALDEPDVQALLALGEFLDVYSRVRSGPFLPSKNG